MELLFRIKYDSGIHEFDGLDMYYGSNSLAAISEVILLSLHAFLHKEVIVQAPAARGFRVVLGKNSIGSLEQIIQVYITNTETLSLFTDLGKNAIYDLLKCTILGGIGIPFVVSKRKAVKAMQALRQERDELQERLERALIRAHLPVKHQGYSASLSLGRENIVTFDADTLNYLETEVVEPDSELIRVGVSRFNARTGTGRFITDIDSLSHSFNPLDLLDNYQKTLMAENLGKVARGDFEPITAVVTRVNAQNGRLKRYQLHSISDA